MKRRFPKMSFRPQNSNRAQPGRAGAKAPAGAQEAANDAFPFSELAGVFRDAARNLAEVAEELLSPDAGHPGDEPPMGGSPPAPVSVAIERYIDEWRARLDERAAEKIAALLVYNAARILGRRMAAREGRAVKDAEDPRIAADVLARMARFAYLFGEPDTWNGLAARAFALEMLARPLGMVSNENAGPGALALDAVKDLTMEWVAGSWRGMIGIFLDLPAPVPPHPDPHGSWSGAIDRSRLGRGLDRAVTGDGLVRMLSGREPSVAGCLMGRDASWLLVHERAGDGLLATRIDRVAHQDVQAVLERVEDTPPSWWQAADVACPRPRCALVLAERAQVEPAAEMVAVKEPADGEVLVITGALPDGWGVWSIPTASLVRSDQMLRLGAGEALPPGACKTRLDARPRLVQGDCDRPMVLLGSDPITLVDAIELAQAGDAGRAGGVRIHDLGRDRVDAICSVSAGPDERGSHVLVRCGRTLHLYRAGQQGSPWWQAGALVPAGSVALMPDVLLQGVAGDQLVLGLSIGFWAFFPVRALLEGASLPLAEMRAQAEGILFRQFPEREDEELRPPPTWIRVGQPCGVHAAAGGTIAVSFADTGGVDIYERGRGLLPEHVASVDGREGGRHIAYLGADDGPGLLLRARGGCVEYRRVARAASDAEEDAAAPERAP